MEPLWAGVTGLLIACGLFLMLERHLLRFVFGLILLSNGVNLAIFTAGRVTRGIPPLIAPDSTLPAPGYANPLPQALILTAIVIGFGLLVFTLVLVVRACRSAGSADVDAMREDAEEETPP
ncbi:MAG: Na+/H+ antiporter subunit C [Ectothiorhodospiraceae bacterium]|jgi:multicomponent Na+:H+ antiporter subunit C